MTLLGDGERIYLFLILTQGIWNYEQNYLKVNCFFVNFEGDGAGLRYVVNSYTLLA